MGGAVLTSALRQVRESDKVYIHPDYSEDTFFHDIALIRVLKPFQLNQAVDVARLPRTNIDLKDVSVVRVDWIPYIARKRLRKNAFSLVVSKLKVKKCEVVGRVALMCADESLGLECDALVGGALVYKHMLLIGISTQYLGRDCSKSTSYENIYKYLNWMEKKISFRSGSNSRLLSSYFLLMVVFLIIKC
ncbi:hypothetical protein Trydic_g4674 [Trypoxylus dichotomus]